MVVVGCDSRYAIGRTLKYWKNIELSHFLVARRARHKNLTWLIGEVKNLLAHCCRLQSIQIFIGTHNGDCVIGIKLHQFIGRIFLDENMKCLWMSEFALLKGKPFSLYYYPVSELMRLLEVHVENYEGEGFCKKLKLENFNVWGKIL